MRRLDRNGDGTLTTKEADPKVLERARAAGDGAGARRALLRRSLPFGELDVHPKDGMVSIDELAEALRRFWVPSGSRSDGRRSAAPMRSSINSTAIRTASSRGPSWRRSPDRSGRSTLTMMK